MRRTQIAALATLGIGTMLLNGPGQRGEAQAPFFGSAPANIQFQPINVTSAMPNQNLSGMFRTPRPPSPLGLGNLFGSPATPGWPPRVASAPQVNSSKNPFQPNLPKNRKYVINPTAPAPGSKTLWNFPFNPFAKRTPKKK
jgi:hypothetical protein